VTALEDDSASRAASASWRSRSRRRAGSTSWTRGKSEGEADRRRWCGGEWARAPFRSGEGDLDEARRRSGPWKEMPPSLQEGYDWRGARARRVTMDGPKGTHRLRLSSSDIGGRSDTDIDRKFPRSGGGERKRRSGRSSVFLRGRPAARTPPSSQPASGERAPPISRSACLRARERQRRQLAGHSTDRRRPPLFLTARG